MLEAAKEGEQIFRGIPTSAGVCRGKILVLREPDHSVARYEIPADEIPSELKRFEHALVETRHQILEIQHKVGEALGAKDASIFDAHILVLEDQTLIDAVTRRISEKLVNVEAALHDFAEQYTGTLSKMHDDYLRERAADIRDITARILNNLAGRTPQVDLNDLSEPTIIVARDVSPSLVAGFEKKHILGLVTDAGSKTSHASIIARSLQLPTIAGITNISRQLQSGQYVLLDGYNGILIVNPTDQTLFEYGQLIRKQVNLQEKLRDVKEKPATTLDGTRLDLSANVEQASDTEAVIASGAEGVGLFRTEFLFIHRDVLPTEEEQYEAYRQVASELKPHEVIIRTLDLGGDKFLSNQAPLELNPFLGCRAIRFCLQEQDIFRTQLRAILRASVEGNIKMMYPMISCVEELDQANALVEECKAQLREENIPFDNDIPIGVMIEIPSAALVAPFLAKKAKFFSIGTNDLMQYTLAVDRLNEKIAHLCEPAHPALIRLIKMTVDAGRDAGIPVGVCGEMASDPILVPLLLGLGVRSLSVTPALVPQVKFLVRRLKIEETDRLAAFALTCSSGSEIVLKSEALAREAAPSLFLNDVLKS